MELTARHEVVNATESMHNPEYIKRADLEGVLPSACLAYAESQNEKAMINNMMADTQQCRDCEHSRPGAIIELDSVQALFYNRKALSNSATEKLYRQLLLNQGRQVRGSS